jgi:hypothetical protein
MFIDRYFKNPYFSDREVRMKINISKQIALIFFTASAILSAGTTWAQLGNRGIPVSCFEYPDFLSPGGSGSILRCYPANSAIAFGGNTNVPTGYYFIVTDVLITPTSIADTTSSFDITLEINPVTASIRENIRLRSIGTANFGEHFSVPYLVLSENEWLKASSASTAGKDVLVRVSGLLVNSVNYLPLISR